MPTTTMLALLSSLVQNFAPVRRTVTDGGGSVHLLLQKTDRTDGVLHMRLCGRKISRGAALRSIALTTAQIHACASCVVVADMTECSNVAVAALPVTAKFVLTHPELRHIVIIGARGPVGLAVATVQRLCGGKFRLFRSLAECEAHASSGRAAAHELVALRVARTNAAAAGGAAHVLRERWCAAWRRLEAG